MYSLSLLLHIIAMRNGADPYKSNEFSIFSLLFIWIRVVCVIYKLFWLAYKNFINYSY